MATKPTYEELEQRVEELDKEAAQCRLAEEALEGSNERITSILGSISDGFFALDPNLVVTYFNKAAEELLGRKNTEVLGRNLFDAFPEAKGSIFEEKYTLAAKEKRHLAFEVYFGVKPYENWYEVRVYPYEDGISVYFQITTERKQAEGALRESEANYRLLFSAESDAILVMEAQTKTLVDANDAALALYGYDRDEFLGLMAMQISAEPEESAAHIERVASGTPSVVSPGPVERLHRKKDGTIFPVEISSGVYILQDRRMVCAIIRDITERRQAEEALRKAHTELEKFNLELEKKVEERTEELKQKNKQLVDAERLAAIGQMANRVAHELRNPLTAIGGFARRINERTPADNPNKKYLRMIVDEVITMESKVSEITVIQREKGGRP
jgi:PAS domain S-box-containing protein